MNQLASRPHPSLRLPINLGLNDGTYAPQAVIDTLATFNDRLSLRNYTTGGNDPLRDRIAELDKVRRDQVFLHCGSGPILKLAIPQLVRDKILSKPMRAVRHVLRKDGYPLYTPRFTYSKIPRKAAEAGLTVHYLTFGPENNFRLDLAEIRRFLTRRPGILYLVNPNNPSGNHLIERSQVEALAKEFPESTIWIDEAYIEYLDPAEFERCSDLVARFSNVMVSRSFSFGFGMAGLRIGYLLANEAFIAKLESKVTDYRLGIVQEQCALAALNDTEHLADLQRACAAAREQLTAGLNALGGIEVFPSQVNFLLCRFTDSTKAKAFKTAIEARGVLIKVFETLGDYSFDTYFRITLGVEQENTFFLEQAAAALATIRPKART